MAHRRNSDQHREEMVRRKGERAARVFGFAPSIRPKPGALAPPFVQRLFAERVRELSGCAALRAIRARDANFRGESQQ